MRELPLILRGIGRALHYQIIEGPGAAELRAMVEECPDDARMADAGDRDDAELDRRRGIPDRQTDIFRTGRFPRPDIEDGEAEATRRQRPDYLRRTGGVG